VTELVGESFAPWSEKARWALDHHHVAYTYREYVPVLSEPWLRWRLGRFSGRVSVPVLIADDGVHADSFAIARHAERVGTGSPLMAPERLAEIEAWNGRSETALWAGRIRVVVRMDEVPGAKTEALPPEIPAALRPAFGAVTGLTLGFLRWKYGFGRDVEAGERAMRDVLEDVRAALAGRPYLLEQFSYADVAMAVVLQMIAPVADRWIALAPAIRTVWSNETLARSFADLIEWRDGLYARHR
jgi:glutathione S-transferase